MTAYEIGHFIGFWGIPILIIVAIVVKIIKKKGGK